MSRKIAIFYHCLFYKDGQALPAAFSIVAEQMGWMAFSGLLDAASEIHCGINGGPESEAIAGLTFHGCHLRFHGAQCQNELRTFMVMEEWLKTHPDWNVLYLHSKGATHPPGHERSWKWRYCMMNNLVSEWRRCVHLLEHGYDSVGCHWLTPPRTPGNQHIWAGNFFWATSDFLRTLPPIRELDRVKISGIDALESRFEAEVWIGNGPRIPKVMDFHPRPDGVCI